MYKHPVFYCIAFIVIIQFTIPCHGQNGSSANSRADTSLWLLSDGFSDSLLLEVVDTSALRIQNPESLISFFNKLHQLENGQRHKVRIAHIGDSHIQADFLTGQLRSRFQQEFGDGGRGLTFPYDLAGTNGPSDYRFTSSTSWQSKRNIHPDRPMKIGVSGITIGTEDDNYFLQLKMKNNCQFDSLQLFHNGPGKNPFTLFTMKNDELLDEMMKVKTEKFHKIKSGETLSGIAVKYGVRTGDLRKWNNLRGDLIYAGKTLKVQIEEQVKKPVDEENLIRHTAASSYSSSVYASSLSRSADHLIIKYDGPSGHEINGLYLENRDTGIVYSMSGVNGAKFEHYNKSKNFQSQFRELNSDLVIIALGTNESLDRDYDSLRLATQFNSFVDSILAQCPQASILTCLNPDTYLRKRKNPNATRINQILKSVCEERKFAFFNTFDVMGGSGGMYRWNRAGLAARDMVHFKVDGYYFLGDLIFFSILEAYENNRTILGPH